MLENTNTNNLYKVFILNGKMIYSVNTNTNTNNLYKVFILNGKIIYPVNTLSKNLYKI